MNKNPTQFSYACATWYTFNWNWTSPSCTLNTYTVSWSFGENANGATVSVCWSNVTADSSWNFTATRNHGSTCNNIIATRTGYTCSTTTNGPASLTANVTNIAWTCAQIINWACWTANWKSRVNAPSTDRCSSWTEWVVTTSWWNHTWSCTWSNWWTTASCSATQLLLPNAGTNSPSQTSITWSWTSWWWTATRYDWSPNGSTWTNKSTGLSHSETSLACNTSYSSRVVRACDDLWNCTGNRTLTSATTTACAVNLACWTANWKSRVNAPSTDRCSSWTEWVVTTSWWNHTWSCTWSR